MRVGKIRQPKPRGPFERSIAKLLKDYPAARRDVEGALTELTQSDWPVPAPPKVSQIPGVGRTMLKVRVASSDMQKGRSGGFRVILDHVVGDEWTAVLAYAKSARKDVSRRDAVQAAIGERSEE